MRLANTPKRRRIFVSNKELMLLCDLFGIEIEADNSECQKALFELSKKLLSIEKAQGEIVFPEIALFRDGN